ncbi:MAG: DmsE family decaheme c-type cytochrome [Nitrospirae bacterium]|nr:DmsE family decaheme c-type cytochrome [Nitrospirota bacterium]
MKKALLVGMDKCWECHEKTSVQWDHTIHAKWKPGRLKSAKAKDVKTTDCETCHGPGSLHIYDPKSLKNIITFGPKSFYTREEQNAVCLKCHEKGELYYWKGNTHGRNLRCTDCHHVMDNISRNGLLNNTSEREICLRCHVQKKKDLLRSPHLSQDEEKMTCSTCHAPHGSDTPGILNSPSVNENCFKCHAEKRGPYLFEHLPVQENCLLCHVPHSSMNRSLLKMRQPFLCLECHSNLPVKGNGMPDAHDVMNPNSRFTYNKGCTNCHPMIHGSRHPSGARLQR